MKNITNIPGEPEVVVNVDDMPPIILTEDECLQAPAQNFGGAIGFRNPSCFLDQMVTDDFTYELSDGREFHGKHVLDKRLYADYMIMRSAFYHRNHCLFVVLYNYKVCPVFFAVYANENDPKQTCFRFKAIRVNRVNNGLDFYKSILNMRELPWRDAKSYDAMVQGIMDPMFLSHDLWVAWCSRCEMPKRSKASREAKLLRRQLR